MPSISVDAFMIPSENTINIPNLFCIILFSFTYSLKIIPRVITIGKNQTTPPKILSAA